MTATIRFPRPGEEVIFNDNGVRIVGVCNGEPRSFDGEHPEHLTHLPVHVRQGNRNLMVATRNIIEWPERTLADDD
jgi:hypothetical protein